MPSLHHRILLANRQRCCICYGMPAVVHYIDGDKSNRDPLNLAVLCPDHHIKALEGTLSAESIRKAKYNWERGCLTVLMSLVKLRD